MTENVRGVIGHKAQIWIKLYAAHYDAIEDNLERFLSRMYFFLTNNPEAMDQKHSLRYDTNIGRCYRDLMTHSEDITNDFI